MQQPEEPAPQPAAGGGATTTTRFTRKGARTSLDPELRERPPRKRKPIVVDDPAATAQRIAKQLDKEVRAKLRAKQITPEVAKAVRARNAKVMQVVPFVLLMTMHDDSGT